MKVEISNPDKVLYPRDKITKQEIADYYTKVSKWMLPFLRDRPLALERYPNGISKKGFYQKNVTEYFPKFIARKKIDDTTYAIVNNKEGLVYMANLAVITFHGWMSTTKAVEKPDKIVIDIDPPDKKHLEDAKKGALAVKKIIEHCGLKTFLLSTGSKGLHVVSPIKSELDFKQVKEFTRKVSELIAKLNPKKYTIELRKDQRRGRVFIDHLRNEKAQLSALPYSLRPIYGAPIAAPLKWVDLGNFKHSDYTLRKMQKLRNNWSDYDKGRRSLKLGIKKIDELY